MGYSSSRVPFTEIALAMSQVCDVITVGIDIGECFGQRV